MKGVSAVIATLLMLVITVALAVTAYGFISGVFTSGATQIFEVIDASCATGAGPNGALFITVRNNDPVNAINVDTMNLRIDDVPVSTFTGDCGTLTCGWSEEGTAIPAGGSISENGGTGILGIDGANSPTALTVGEALEIKLIGPTGRPQTAIASC